MMMFFHKSEHLGGFFVVSVLEGEPVSACFICLQVLDQVLFLLRKLPFLINLEILLTFLILLKLSNIDMTSIDNLLILRNDLTHSLIQGKHHKVVEARLRLRHVRVLPVAQEGNGVAEGRLDVTLVEKLLKEGVDTVLGCLEAAGTVGEVGRVDDHVPQLGLGLVLCGLIL
jgi:hypothetical protein